MCVNENNKDRYTLIEQSNTLVKQLDCALPSAICAQIFELWKFQGYHKSSILADHQPFELLWIS